ESRWRDTKAPEAGCGDEGCQPRKGHAYPEMMTAVPFAELRIDASGQRPCHTAEQDSQQEGDDAPHCHRDGQANIQRLPHPLTARSALMPGRARKRCLPGLSTISPAAPRYR